MTETQSSIQIVHTTTVTPAMRDARRSLKYAGVFSLVIATWLGIGLSVCSVNPELSTRVDHLLGSVTHTVCSYLLGSLGLMSFSVVLLIARSGRLLCAARLPLLSKVDLLVYGVFLLLRAAQLQLALNTTAFGAPIGGAVGVWLSQSLSPLGELGAQGVMCLSLFGLFFIHSHSAQKSQREEEARDESLLTKVHLNAQPVKSMSAYQQQQHSHIFDQVALQPPEFKEESQRFEAVDSFYDDLAQGSSAPNPEQEEEISRDFIFHFEMESDEPRLTLDHTPKMRAEDRSAEPRMTSGMNARLRESITDPKRGAGSSHQPSSKVEPRARVSSQPSASPVRSPIEQLSQEVAPKISRELILQRGLDAQEVTLALIDSQIGPSVDHYIFTSPISPSKPIYEVTEYLNMHIRRALGRTEPPVLLSHYVERGQHYVEVSWPKRARALTETQAAIQTLRKLKREQSLKLYLGELSDGEQALLSFKEIRSLLITGGKGIENEMGLDLILMNLIHQAQPEELRVILFDNQDAHQLSRAPLPHLYCPTLSRREQLVELLDWLPSEYRRRRSLMARHSLQGFEVLQKRRPQEVRIVLMIPQLSQLDAELQ